MIAGQVSPDDEVRARVDDPETSHEAARSVSALREKQAAVLNIIRDLDFGATDQEIANWYWSRDLPPQSPSGLRTRRAELVTLGLVEWSGEHRRLGTGRQARVWRAT